MANINIDGVRDSMKERIATHKDVFGIAMDNGFGVSDFKLWPVDQKYVLRRESLGNITQPGKTGTLNFTPGFYASDTREGKLEPGKVDLKFEEEEIDEINDTFMQEVNPSDVEDVASMAGADYIIDKVFAKVASEVNDSFYSAEKGSIPLGALAGMTQGGLNIIDGFNAKFDDAIASGEIPAGNIVPKTAPVTAANVVATMRAIIDKVYSIDYIRREMVSPSFKNVNYSIICPSEWEGHLIDAFEALLYKNDSYIAYNKDSGIFTPKKLKRTAIKFRSYMDLSEDDAFFSPDDNLFHITQKGKSGDTARSNCNLKIQEIGRGFQWLLDWKRTVDFAHGGFIVPFRAI